MAQGRGHRWVGPALAVAALGVVVVLTLGPDAIPGLGAGTLDRTAHAGAYAALTSLALLALPTFRRPSIRAAVGLVLIICALGGLLEIAQGFEHRDADIVDAAANAAGAALVLVIWLAGRAAGARTRTRRAGGPALRVRDEPVLAAK